MFPAPMTLGKAVTLVLVNIWHFTVSCVSCLCQLSRWPIYFFIPVIEVLQFFFAYVNICLFLGCEDWGTQSLWLGKQGCKYGSLQPGRHLLWICYSFWVSQKSLWSLLWVLCLCCILKSHKCHLVTRLEICLLGKKKKTGLQSS